MARIILITFLCILSSSFSYSQNQTQLDSLKQEILEIQADVEHINMNLEKSKAKFQRGILVATIGYTLTIAGGLMLGRENDELGQVLLVTGGVTGITGTVLLVDAFKFLGRTRRE
jgi:hypothetical protein